MIHSAWNLSGGFETLALRRKVSLGGLQTNLHTDLSTDDTTSAGFEDEGEVDAGWGVRLVGPNTGTETLLEVHIWTSCNIQDGNEGPDAVRRTNENNRSCGVSLVAVQRRERWLCNTTGMTCSQ